jgi:hypothetical protein
MEQLDYNLLFRWFVGLSMDGPVWDHSTFHQESGAPPRLGCGRRLLRVHPEAGRGRGALVRRAFYGGRHPDRGLVLAEEFSPQGWAVATVHRRPQSGGGFPGGARTNASHVSTTDPEARLAIKSPGQTAKLCYLGHALMDNRHGLVAAPALTLVTGNAERGRPWPCSTSCPTAG